MRKFLSIIIVLFSLTYASSVHATATNDVEAQELKTMISEHMDKLKEMYGNVPSITLEYDGEVSVTPKGSYYKILLPKVSFGVSNPNNPADAFNMLLDPIGINASKQGDDAWSMSVAIPTPIKATDGNDETIFNIDIGQQNASLFFVPSLATAPKYNFSYKDITIESLAGEKLQISIGELSSKLTLNDNGQGLWSGPARAEIKNVTITSNDLNLNIDSLKMDGDYKEFDLKSMALFSEKILNTSIGNIDAAFNDSFSSLFTSMNGVSADMSINGVSGSYTDPETNKTDDFSLAKASLGFAWDKLITDSAELGFSVSIGGVKTSNTPSDIQGIIPTLAEFELQITKLPIQSLLKMFQEAMDTNGTPAQNSKAAIGTGAIELLTQAGTKLILHKNNLETPEFGVISYGEATANSQAKMKAVAEVTLKLRNLDAVIAKYSQSESTPRNVKQMMGIAPMLQAMGAQETDAKGNPVRSYHLQLAADGKILLNGSDMGPMLGMGRPPAQQQ